MVLGTQDSHMQRGETGPSADTMYLCVLSHFSCVWLCDPMNCSVPGRHVHHQLPKFTQTHVHQVANLFLIVSYPNCSVQFSHSLVFDFVTPRTAAPQASLSITKTPTAYSNSCLWSRCCHPTNSSSVVPFSSCLQSFPASGSFPVSQFFPSGGQSIGVSASASVLPMNIQDWFPL